jgi:hypothetical protein
MDRINRIKAQEYFKSAPSASYPSCPSMLIVLPSCPLHLGEKFWPPGSIFPPRRETVSQEKGIKDV